MVFNSLIFLLFFGIVLAVHYSRARWSVKKAFLLIASYVFYGAWNPPFVLLLMLSTVLDWTLAARIAAADSLAKRRALLVVSLIVNLGLLAFFKYGSFLVENFVHLAGLLGITYSPATPNIILPVGISFYTFQTLSYTLDVYSGREKPWKSFGDFALYVTFFPQLVAGPIVRSGDFLPQCDKFVPATQARLGWGFSLLLIGLAQKLIVADALLAPIADKVFHPGVEYNTLAAWTGVIAFAGQIFSDFSGYSTCAIGVAACLGFSFQSNFRCPYAAVGLSDFWRRWHVSLSTWLRDYLYIPLGGNRRGVVRMNTNLLATMLLGGLWHGAAWTFVVWGGLHGFYLIAERYVRRVLVKLNVQASAATMIIGVLVTYGLVCITWVFFRATTFDSAFSLTSSMLGFASADAKNTLTMAEVAIVGLVTVTMMTCQWILRDRDLEAAANRAPWLVRGVAISAVAMALITMSGDDRAFIYFQF